MKIDKTILNAIEKELDYAEKKHPKQNLVYIQDWVVLIEKKLQEINKYDCCKFPSPCSPHSELCKRDPDNIICCKLIASIAIALRGLKQFKKINIECRKEVMKENK